MSQQIEGVPEGWRLVRIGKAKRRDWAISNTGVPSLIDHDIALSKNYVIIEKIEQPKQYRPFKNAKEFEPHRDRWWKYKEESDCYQRTTYFSDDCNSGEDWETSFYGRVFDDGTPFGVEVTE